MPGCALPALPVSGFCRSLERCTMGLPECRARLEVVEGALKPKNAVHRVAAELLEQFGFVILSDVFLGVHRHGWHDELLEQCGAEGDRLRLDGRLVAAVHGLTVGRADHG